LAKCINGRSFYKKRVDRSSRGAIVVLQEERKMTKKNQEHKKFDLGEAVWVKWRNRDYVGQYRGWNRDDGMHLVSFPGWPNRSEVQFYDKEIDGS
jgi:hypothetical protein